MPKTTLCKEQKIKDKRTPLKFRNINVVNTTLLFVSVLLFFQTATLVLDTVQRQISSIWGKVGPNLYNFHHLLTAILKSSCYTYVFSDVNLYCSLVLVCWRN